MTLMLEATVSDDYVTWCLIWPDGRTRRWSKTNIYRL